MPWPMFVLAILLVIFFPRNLLANFLKRPIALLLPMWPPISVIIVAGALLFLTEQGRDLGIGLLGNGKFKIFLLALALFYWATANWHVARLGLNRKFGTDPEEWPDKREKGYGPWLPRQLRWLPRLVGVFAYLLAAASLTFAALHEINPSETIELSSLLPSLPLWPVAFAPPFVIVYGTFILWCCDRGLLATLDSLKKLQAERKVSRRAVAPYYAAIAVSLSRAVARRPVAWVTLFGVTIVVLLWLIADRLPQEFAFATSCVLGSALAFLLVVNTRRWVGDWTQKWLRKHKSVRLAKRLQEFFHETKNKHALSSTILSWVLSGVALLVMFWAWWHPVHLGTFAGSMVIGFFIFGAYTAIIGFVRLFSKDSFATICTFLLPLAIGGSEAYDVHNVRLCGDPRTPCPTGTTDLTAGSAGARAWKDTRPSVEEAARAWYAQATKDWPNEQPVPMLIIATAGGGIRAAYWTATVLERLDKDVRRHLFAISGVSGGSVGAAAYMAAMAAPPMEPPLTPTKILDHDFLAPALATLAFVDVPSNILPNFGQPDRSYTLERTWEVASNEVLARPFLSFFPTRQELKDTADWRPALLLNATHEETGKRIITSHLKIENRVFLDSFDAHHLLNSDMPASTAAHNSARFTYISPAGKLISRERDGDDAKQLGSILDGGYFENFGAATALQLAREARRVLGEEKVRLIILQISSDPSLTKRDRSSLNCDASSDTSEGFLLLQNSDGVGLRWRHYSFFDEFMAPIDGVLASRRAHSTLASQELAYEICAERRVLEAGTPYPLETAQPVLDRGPFLPLPDRRPEFAHLAMCNDEKGKTVPPLGWVLSSSMSSRFTHILDECTNGVELKRLMAVFPSPQREMRPAWSTSPDWWLRQTTSGGSATAVFR